MCRRRDMLTLSCRFVWLRSGTLTGCRLLAATKGAPVQLCLDMADVANTQKGS